MTETCANCKFNKYHDWEYRDAECRRHAPLIDPAKLSDSLERYGKWPETKREDWCGEFKPVQRVETVMFDYKKMLSAYLRLIIDEEGVSYLSYGCKSLKSFGLSDDEVLELKRMANEWLDDDLKYDTSHNLEG